MHSIGRTSRVVSAALGSAIVTKCALQRYFDAERPALYDGPGVQSQWTTWTANRTVLTEQSDKPASRRYPFVILGSGTAAHAVLETLTLNNPEAEILMISDTEGTLPRMDKSTMPSMTQSPLEERLRETYDEWRRPLSNALGDFKEQVSLVRTSKVKIDVEERKISFNERSIHYDKCVLATAGKPREFYVLDRDKIAFSGAHETINTLHSIIDFNNLAQFVSAGDSTGKSKHVTVVGGGYLGTEVVAALAETGKCKVTHVMGERTPLAQYLPSYLSDYVARKLIGMGVDIRAEALVTELKPTSNHSEDHHQPSITTSTGAGGAIVRRTRSRTMPSSGETGLTLSLVGSNQVNLDTDYLVLASTNVQPDLMGLDDAAVGLEVAEGGIVTNAALEAYGGLFVAGNAATFYDTSIGRRRVDTFDHAVASGMWAAHNMMATERLEQYTYQPCFRSSLAGTGLSFVGVGKMDARLETVGVWFRPGFDSGSGAADDMAAQDYRRGIVYFLERGRVVGVLLCNAPEMLDRAREVLRSKRVVSDPADELPRSILLAPHHWLKIIATKAA